MEVIRGLGQFFIKSPDGSDGQMKSYWDNVPFPIIDIYNYWGYNSFLST